MTELTPNEKKTLDAMIGKIPIGKEFVIKLMYREFMKENRPPWTPDYNFTNEYRRMHDDETPTRITEYLVEKRFANYTDNLQGGIFLTERKGIELKEFGFIDSYLSYETECLKMAERQKVRDGKLYWIQFWIAFGAIAAALYYLLEILNHIFGFYCN